MTASTTTGVRVAGGIGESPVRPDGVPKVQGNFAYASDLSAEGMLWAATLRSPHAHARIVRVDIGPALAMPGVWAVLTEGDVPGRPVFGLEKPDQPVLAGREVNFWGEAVAVVAAEDQETARRAVRAIGVEWEVLAPQTDPEEAIRRGDVWRHMKIRRGDPDATGEIVVEGYYETAMQDQAPLGTEAGLAVPDGEGGVDLYATSQWVHKDHEQVVACLGVRADQVRIHPAGIGGAFGAREDLSLQIHLCLLALRTGRPVKMVYNRSESFQGHVHRHPARMWYRHEANRDGRLVRVEARIILDGGAYHSTSAAVVANACYFSVGPYQCPSVSVDGFGVRTNNPPAGAMRGFGANQPCFAVEAQMDKLADLLDLDPLDFRLRNALASGDVIPTSGQLIEGPLPTAEVIRSVMAMPLPEPNRGDDPLLLPGGTGLTTPPAAVRRGIGYAVGMKNLAFSEAFDDFAEARVVLTPAGAEVHTSAMEVGQGMITVLQQIARTALGMEHVAMVFDDTSQIGSAGSTSASRQTQMAGGAVLEAATEVRRLALERFDGDDLTEGGVWRSGRLVATLEQVCRDGPIEYLARFRHPPTSTTDENGQGSPHADFGVAAHRAVVDVDPELGLVRVVQVDCALDVGRVLNPQSLLGQAEGGILQGVGHAVMEEVVVADGKILNPSFTDYLLPTILDAPDVEVVTIEQPSLWGPFGAKGMGEMSTISATPAVVAAIRNATGRELNRAPVRPQDICGV